MTDVGFVINCDGLPVVAVFPSYDAARWMVLPSSARLVRSFVLNDDAKQPARWDV